LLRQEQTPHEKEDATRGRGAPIGPKEGLHFHLARDVGLVPEEGVDGVVVLVADLEGQPARIEKLGDLTPKRRLGVTEQRVERGPGSGASREVQNGDIVADEVSDEPLAEVPQQHERDTNEQAEGRSSRALKW